MAKPAAVLGTLSLIVFLRVLGVFLVLVGFTDYWRELGGSPATAGVGFGAYALALALFLIPLGWLSDRLGRRWVMVGALVVSALGGLLAAFAPNAAAFAVGRFIQGAGAVNGVALAVVGEIGDPEKRTRRMAVMGAAAGGGVVMGLVLSATLTRLGVTIPQILVAYSIVTFLTLPLVWVTVPMSRPEGPAVQEAPDRRPARGTILLLGLGAFAVNFSLMGLLVFAKDLLVVAAPGIPYDVALLLMIVPGGLGMFVTARLVDRGLARAVGFAAATLLALAPLTFLGPNGAVLVVGAGILFFLAHSSLSSLLPSLAARLAASTRRGLAQGIQSTLQYAGTAAGPALVGVLYAGRMTSFIAGAFLASGLLAGAVILVATRPTPPA